ncbi:MAG: lysophospholipid acyltransferase family protein [Gallionellaceae bacterium]|nr:lysophospholipid acyltransferase family protein [Gallionellaceae bacterium]
MTSISSTAANRIFYLPKLRTTLIAAVRGLRVASHVLYGLLLVSLFPLLKTTAQHHIVKYWSRKLLDILHVGLETHGYYPAVTVQGRLLLANHISWLDAVALNAVLPAYFVAKHEVGNWPLLGWIFHGIHTLFIKRDFKMDTLRINHQIAKLLAQGERVALFPQGTTTDGTQLGHFHSSLLQGAVAIEAAICPIAIRYHDGRGKFNLDAAFIGDMTFIQSLWKILCSPALHVTLMYLPTLTSIGKNRRMLAAEAQSTIYRALARLPCNLSCPAPDSSVMVTWHDIILPTTRADFINS